MPDGARAEVDGQLWRSLPIEVLTFADGVESWTRVCYRTTDGGEGFSTHPSSAVRVVVDAATRARSAAVLGFETLLAEILAETAHAHPASSRQVALRNLLPDLEGLDERETAFGWHHRRSVDVVVYHRIAYAEQAREATVIDLTHRVVDVGR